MKFHLVLALVASMAQAQEFPLEYSNCGISFSIDSPPQRAVTLNQGTTEVMLGLGLEDRMAGTAYLDDEIWPEFAEAYNSVTILEEWSYPDIARLMSVNPDFMYASYRSAFQAKTEETQKRIEYLDVLNECNITVESSRGNATYCRHELAATGIPTYLQTPSCVNATYRPEETTIDTVYAEINDIAEIFGVQDKAASLISTIEDHFQEAQNLREDSPLSVFWLDSWDDTTPFVGACCGSPNAIIEYAGAKNVMSDVGVEEKKTWADANWTDIVQADPDVIIVIDASWDKADEKLFHLCNNDLTRNMKAVQNRRFITVPFSASTLGVRIGSLSYNLAEAVTALVSMKPLSSVQFTETTFEGGATATGKSGAKVYTRLPIVNGVDLETFCPGGASSIFITDDSDQEPTRDGPTDAPTAAPTPLADAAFTTNVWSIMLGAIAVATLTMI